MTMLQYIVYSFYIMYFINVCSCFIGNMHLIMMYDIETSCELISENKNK